MHEKVNLSYCNYSFHHNINKHMDVDEQTKSSNVQRLK